MIFVTVGSQLPFDRMIRAVDQVAGHFPDFRFVAQVFGMTYRPRYLETLDYIAPADFRSYIDQAELIISHAGTGTILSVAQTGKPLIVFPRLGHLHETRNDHQEATCRGMEPFGLQVAWNAQQLLEKMQAYRNAVLPVMDRIAPHASETLLGSIRSFIAAQPGVSVPRVPVTGR